MAAVVTILAGALMAAGPWVNQGWSAIEPASPLAITASEPAATKPPRPAVTVEPTGPPRAVQAEEGWPSEHEALVQALVAINARRNERHAGPVQLDMKLTEAAKEHARDLGIGAAQPHEGFPERVRSRGWKYRDCGIQNRGFGNVSEGISWGGQTPAECILILDSSRNPREGHRQDFEDPAITHVGIGFEPDQRWGRICVVDYGADCGSSPNLKPSPAPSRAAPVQPEPPRTEPLKPTAIKPTARPALKPVRPRIYRAAS